MEEEEDEDEEQGEKFEFDDSDEEHNTQVHSVVVSNNSNGTTGTAGTANLNLENTTKKNTMGSIGEPAKGINGRLLLPLQDRMSKSLPRYTRIHIAQFSLVWTGWEHSDGELSPHLMTEGFPNLGEYGN